MIMVIVKNFDDDYWSLKYGAASENSKLPLLPLRGIDIPIYCFASQSTIDSGSYGGSYMFGEEQSLLDSLLLSQWEDCYLMDLLKYDVTTCENKVLGGRRKFIAQLNEEGNSGCPEFKENRICHQLDPFLANYMKLCDMKSCGKLLLCVASGEKANPEIIYSDAVPNDVTLIIINVNPVEYGHVFLVPSDFNVHPQFPDARSLEMVTQIAAEINDCSFRVFYGCSSAIANHLYFQACYFADPLPVELLPVVKIFGSKQETGIHIFNITDYPIKALSLEGNGNLKLLVEMVADICSCLQECNIPYGLLISKCGERMILFPQVHASAKSCNLSAWECGGHVIFKSRSDFDQATEESVLKHLSAVSLDDEGFEEVKQLCCSVASKISS